MANAFTKIVKWLLAIALAAVFLMAGSAKLTSRFDAATHSKLVSGFQGYANLYPFSLTGWNADIFRTVVGVTEVTFAALALCPHYTRLSAFVFIGLMAGATFAHVQLKQPFELAAGLLAASVLLFLVSGDAVAHSSSSSSSSKKKTQ